MAKKVKCFVVKYKSRADYTVYLCKYKSEQKNQQIIENGELTKYESQADFKLYIEKYKSRADIIIIPDNFPR